MELIAQPDFFQGFFCAVTALTAGDAANRQRQLHIGKDSLVGNQVVALEHKADGMVAVGVPIPVFVILGGNTADDQLPAVVTVKSANDIEQRGLSRTAGAEDRNKFIVPQVQTNVVESLLDQLARPILFRDIF